MKHFSTEERRLRGSKVRYIVLALCLLVLVVTLPIPRPNSVRPEVKESALSPESFVLPWGVVAYPGQVLSGTMPASQGIRSTLDASAHLQGSGIRDLGSIGDSIQPGGGRISIILEGEESCLSFPGGAVPASDYFSIRVRKGTAFDGERITEFEITPRDLVFNGEIFLSFRSRLDNGSMEFLAEFRNGEWYQSAVAAVQQSVVTFPIRHSGRYAIGEIPARDTRAMIGYTGGSLGSRHTSVGAHF